ncbi:hypothetical protein diail_12322 [Diaporthe ilicicola]|nr:hypothetical protein diail_12322 [Diaporthe ilicicola]
MPPTGTSREAAEPGTDAGLAHYSKNDDVVMEKGDPSQVQSEPKQQDPSPPNEGLFAWLQVVGAFALNLNTWGLMNAYGVFQTFYQLNFLSSESSSNIAWIGSTQAFLLFLVSVITGPVFDAGHLRSLLCIGLVLVVVGMMLTSIASQYWHVFLAQAVMMGLGFGCLYLPAPAVVSQYFHRRTALAMGVSSLGAALGGVIYPIVFEQLQPRIGFGWTVRVIGFIIFGTNIIASLFMRSRAPQSAAWTIVDRTAFRDIPYLLLNLGLVFGFMGLYIVLYYIQLFSFDRTDVSRGLSNYLLIIINGCSLFGRTVPGYYADNIGSINIQSIAAFLGAILTFCLLAIHNAPALVIYCVLIGICAGTFMGLPAAGVVTLSADKSKIGTRLGMTLATVGIGVLD